MNSRLFPVILILLLVCLTAFAGCSSTTNATPGTISTAQETAVAENTRTVVVENPAHLTPAPQKQSITEQLASVQSTNLVFLESYRMFRNIKTTEYVHPPYTDDDAAGIYKFDCLGFVDHVLMNVTPDSYKDIGKGVTPSIESYSVYFNKLDTAIPNTLGWIKVTRTIDLKPGDVCLWLKPSTLDTGHIWIIAGTPSVNPKRSDEVLVRIFDSSEAHSDDSRTGSVFKTGLGSGILGFMVDRQGNPIGLYWDGGASTSAGEKDTTIVCARLNRQE
jgi:hypothetical protein